MESSLKQQEEDLDESHRSRWLGGEGHVYFQDRPSVWCQLWMVIRMTRTTVGVSLVFLAGAVIGSGVTALICHRHNVKA